MELPEFNTLCEYAAGIGDLPQRFYVTPEDEEISDLILKVSGKLLPVHKTILALNSKLFHTVAADCTHADDDVLPIEDKYNLAATLALLRFIYEPIDLCADSVKYLCSKKLIVGVFEIASYVNYKKFDLLISLAKKNMTINDISSFWETGFDTVQDTCVEYLINNKLPFYDEGSGAMVDWCDALPDDPKLLKVALVVAMMNGKKRKCGEASGATKLVKSVVEMPILLNFFSPSSQLVRRAFLDSLPPATFTQAMSKDERTSLETDEEYEGTTFIWNGLRFSMLFETYKDEDGLGVFVKTHQDLDAGQTPPIELRVENCKDPSKSVTMPFSMTKGWKKGASSGYR